MAILGFSLGSNADGRNNWNLHPAVAHLEGRLVDSEIVSKTTEELEKMAFGSITETVFAGKTFYFRDNIRSEWYQSPAEGREKPKTYRGACRAYWEWKSRVEPNTEYQLFSLTK